MGSTSLILERLSSSLSKGSHFLDIQALSIGQNAFDFNVSFFEMLHLMFFLLHDGAALSRQIEKSVPLESGITDRKFNPIMPSMAVVWVGQGLP